MNSKKILTFILSILLVFLSIPKAKSIELEIQKPIKEKSKIVLGFGEVDTKKQKYHYGVDIAAQKGAEVLAPVNGRVTFCGYTPSGSGTVSIKTGNGYKISLLQIREVSVSEGEKVTRGQPIGRVGISGDKSTSVPHIHLSIRGAEGNYLNPEKYLPTFTAAKQEPNSKNNHDGKNPSNDTGEPVKGEVKKNTSASGTQAYDAPGVAQKAKPKAPVQKPITQPQTAINRENVTSNRQPHSAKLSQQKNRVNPKTSHISKFRLNPKLNIKTRPAMGKSNVYEDLNEKSANKAADVKTVKSKQGGEFTDALPVVLFSTFVTLLFVRIRKITNLLRRLLPAAIISV